MKNLSLSIFVLLIVLILLKVDSKKKKKITPKAMDLKNHYGTPSVGSPYGSDLHSQYIQYVEANPDTFMPFKSDGKKKILKKLEYKKTEHSNNQLNPHFIKSGDMTNIAPSAKKVISPEIAKPKIKFEANVIYPSEVEVAVFKGMKKEFHNLTAYDTKEGKLVHTKALINKPHYIREKKVMDIGHPHDFTFNLKTGSLIAKDEDDKVLHGLEENNGEICNKNLKESRKKEEKILKIDENQKKKKEEKREDIINSKSELKENNNNNKKIK